MNEMKHTPGPFTVAGPSFDLLDPTKDGDYAIVDGNGHIVAEAFRLVAKDTELPALANARLFAASPALLAACKDARNCLAKEHDRGIDLSDDSRTAYDRLCDAIDAAGGEA